METIYSLSKSTSSSTSACSDDDGVGELRRGPWTAEEDSLLIHYISGHGEGRWNLLAKCSGLKRTGKSCRLRWLNYLKPDVKRGNLSPEEQLLILQLHSKWGNRWSKIAQYLQGRTDNEIKNYWRTRVQKQARHLKLDPNSTEFQELIRTVWMPRLLQKVQLGTNPSQDSSATQVLPYDFNNNHHQILNQTMENMSSTSSRNSPSSMSSSESPNMSSMPQISEFYENPNYPIVNNSYCHSQTECYNADSITFDIETLNSGAHVTTIGGSIGTTNYSTGQNNWLIDETGHCLWSNLDEFWQVRQSQERYNSLDG